MSNAMIRAAQLDNDKVKNGVEVTFYMEDKPYRVTITKGGEFNDELKKHSEKLMRPYRQANMDFDKLPPKKQKEFLATLYSTNVVLNWNEEDFEQEYSVDNCRAVLEAVDEFRIFIINQSTDQEKFRRKAVEDISGN